MSKDKDKEEDYRIEPVEGAPISLDKVSKLIEKTGKAKSNLYVLLDNGGSGFVNDSPDLLNVTIEERENQAMYFLSLNLPLPPYLKKYLEYMYEDDKQDIDAMYKYAKTNAELKQIIGIIQLVGGSLNAAKKQNKSVRLYIEEPETRMHPKRERRVISLLEKLKKDYGYNEDTTKEVKEE